MQYGTVLVTGGAGYIGSHIVLALQDAGFHTVVLDNLSTGRLQPLHRQCAVVEGDIGDRSLVYKTLTRYRCDAVIHLAGSIVVPESLRYPLDYYQNNTVQSHALIEACIAFGIGAFLFSSTAAVYGIPPSVPVAEDAPTLPINTYGASKLMTEQILLDAAQAYQLPVSILRYFNVAGADPARRTGQKPGAGTHLIKAACDVALNNRDHLAVFGTDYPTSDGTCIRDFIHVSDLASAHLATLNYLLKGRSMPIANCGYGRGFSVLQVVDAIERVSGKKLNIAKSPRRPGDPPEIVSDSTRLRNLTGWAPKFDDLEKIIEDNLEWMRLADR